MLLCFAPCLGAAALASREGHIRSRDDTRFCAISFERCLIAWLCARVAVFVRSGVRTRGLHISRYEMGRHVSRNFLPLPPPISRWAISFAALRPGSFSISRRAISWQHTTWPV